MKCLRPAILVAVFAAFIISGALPVAAGTYALTVLSNNPVAYWRLDETNGSLAARDWAGGHDCAYANVQLGLAGHNPTDPDTAAGFGLLTLTNSYAGEINNSGLGISNLDFSQPSGGNAEFSVEAWEKAGVTDTNGTIIAKGCGNGGEQFVLDFGKAGGELRFFVRDAADGSHSAGATNIPDGNWHHVAGVCDEADGAVHLYVDGADIVDGTITAGSGLLATSGGTAGASLVSIGSRTSSKTNNYNLPFTGTIDEVAVYNYPLSATQVQSDYQAGRLLVPLFTNWVGQGAGLVLHGRGGVSNTAFTLLSATNLTVPWTNWTAEAANTFDGNGNFSLTSSPGAGVSRKFYRLQTPPEFDDLWVPACGALLGVAITNGDSQDTSAFEKLIGRPDDVLRIYHTPGSWTALTADELAYLSAGRRLLESVKPNSAWAAAVGVANGGSATVDAQMTSLAKSIAAVKPLKIMLIVWHEPENDVTGSVTGANAGTTTQYVEMWHNVRNIFDANGATNVIWCWDMENYPPLRYLIAPLWPGNPNVDWVMWDQYQSSASNPYTNVLQDCYDWMTTNSTATNNYLGKPWGLAEWGVGINSYAPTTAAQTNGINGLNEVLNQSYEFPKIKLVEYFDEGVSALLPGAVSSYSNFANSPYMEQKCPP